MKNHKLVLILKILSKKELNAFVRLVNTTFFNRKEEVVLLVEYLKKQYPKFSENLIKKEKIFKVISKEKTYNKRFLDDTVYHTIKLLEQFLVMEHLNNDSFRSSKILAKELENRKLTDLSLKEFDKSKKLLAKKKLDLGTDVELFSINLHTHLLMTNTLKKEDNAPLIKANEKLDTFYWKNKLMLNDEFNTRSELIAGMGKALDDEQIKKINAYSIEHTADLIFNSLCFLNSEKTNFEFEQIFNDLKQNHGVLNEKIIRILINSLINYCKKQYAKTQDLIFTKHWFNLYKFGYELGLFISKDKIDDTNFLNMVHLGLVHKEVDWVKFFIEDYKQYLNDNMLYNLAAAMLHFETKNYNNVLNNLVEVPFGHINQNLTARSLIAKTYFEMKEYDLLDTHLKAYEIYLRRQTEISEQLKQVNLNFVSAVKKLALAQFDQKAMASLQKDLKEKPIAYKSWFNTTLNKI